MLHFLIKYAPFAIFSLCIEMCIKNIVKCNCKIEKQTPDRRNKQTEFMDYGKRKQPNRNMHQDTYLQR